MRSTKQYKIFSTQYKNRRLDFPMRILKFKRTKWNALLSFIQNRRRLSAFFFFKRKINKLKAKNLEKFLVSPKVSSSLKSSLNTRISFNNYKLQVPLKRWERISQVTKQGLAMRRSFYQLYNLQLSYTVLKKFIFRFKNLSYRTNLLRSIMQFEYRIDILLWRLRFFKSSSEARLYINNGLIQINQKRVKCNYFVKQGDVITFIGKLDFLANLQRLKKTFLDSSFVEVDLYTNSLIVLEASKENNSENSLFTKHYFNLDIFRYSFR